MQYEAFGRSMSKSVFFVNVLSYHGVATGPSARKTENLYCEATKKNAKSNNIVMQTLDVEKR